MASKALRLSFFACVVLGRFLAAPEWAAAATKIVTNLGDDGSPGQLRTLINAAVTGDTIVIPPGLITLSGASNENANAGGDLDITKNLTIQGTGPGLTIIHGGGIDRVFHIDPSGAGITVTLSGMTITGGHIITPTGLVGGGIANFGTLTITNCTISGNTANFGGGIENQGTLTLTNVTINDNTAGDAGGGIRNSGTLTITNSTISGNNALGGGGIRNSGTLTITNTTISQNASTAGGGIQNSGTSVTLKNTIVANNPGGNCSGTITSLGHNLDNGTACAFSGPGDLSNTNPLLGTLQNNGGFTLTYALLPGSPAINAGDNNGCPSIDQRGILRPQGTTCDIGSYELGPPGAAVALSGSLFHTGQSVTYQATITPGLTSTQADIYTGALLPDAITFLSLVEATPGVVSVVLGTTPVPFRTNVMLALTTISFTHTFQGSEPAGPYFTYAGLAVPGSNPFLPSNQLSLGVQAFQFTP